MQMSIGELLVLCEYGLWYIDYHGKYLKRGFFYPVPSPFPNHKKRQKLVASS